MALIQAGLPEAKLGAAQLWYDKPHKRFYLLVSLEIEVADPAPETQQWVVGVDLGQRCLAVATDTQKDTKFIPGTAARKPTTLPAEVRGCSSEALARPPEAWSW